MENSQNENLKSLKEIEIELETSAPLEEGKFASLSDTENEPANKKTYLTQKEIILEEILTKVPGKTVNYETKNSFDKEDDDKNPVSRLNPETEILTKKDRDELIIKSNESLKKSNNRKNKNQPL